MKNFIAVAFLFACVGIGMAAPKDKNFTNPVNQNDGDTRVGVSTQCVSTSWNAVVASRAKRRLLVLYSAKTNGGTICLGTDDSGGTCQDAQKGAEIGTTDSYRDVNEGPLYCRSRAGTQILKGFDEYDSKD